MTRETSEILPVLETFLSNCDKNTTKNFIFVASVVGRKQTPHSALGRDKSVL